MNITNQMYRMFAEMKKGYREKDDALLQHGAQCWLDCNPENPFVQDTPEFNAFFQMQRCYIIWKRGDISKKINYRHMFKWAEELCRINPKQPYKFDKAADEADRKAAEEEAKRREEELARKAAVEEAMKQKVVVSPKKVVLGVPDAPKVDSTPAKKAVPVTDPEPVSAAKEEQQPKKSLWKRFSGMFKRSDKL